LEPAGECNVKKFFSVMMVAVLILTACAAPPQPHILSFDLQAGTVSGTARGICIVEVFSDGGDEGARFEGQAVADSNGAFTFEKSVPLTRPFLTATAADPDGRTGEFSQPVQ
jgi:hypothetical protein